MRLSAMACGLALAALAAPGLAGAEQIFGVTTTNALVRFDSATPGATTVFGVTGLGAGEIMLGIDFRPANNQLYTIANTGNLYRLQEGAAIYQAILVNNIGMGFTPGTSIGFDFNPVPDRLRIVTSTDQNFRVNPDSGATIPDTSITPSDLVLVGSAYTNSFAGATSTKLYGIDSLTSQLVTTANPNGGFYSPLGSLGILLSPEAQLGFDISGATGIGYFNNNASFYQVNLTTGGATLIGTVGTGQSLRGLAVAPAGDGVQVVPEASTWTILIAGFTGVGAVLRSRRPSLLRT